MKMRKKNTEDTMRDNYDFSKMKAMPNPYAARLKQHVTIRLDVLTVAYFKRLAGEVGMPYQNLINLYLRDCAQKQLRPQINWKD